MTARPHQPVLLEAAVAALNVRPQGRYVDATFGRGGHTEAILAGLDTDGRLTLMDRDPQAVAWARRTLGGDARVSIRQESFERLKEVVAEQALLGRVDGVLLDLGVSSPQLDDPERGFSFSQDGPLDMRMDPAGGPSAAEWLARADEDEIAAVLWELGEERRSRRIARAICRRREREPITRTADLAALIAAQAGGARQSGKHPATRSFQALRMHINRELECLDAALAGLPEVLAPLGRVAVISFHSLEDRRVKRFLRGPARGAGVPRRLPVRELPETRWPMRELGKPQRPGSEEVEANPRSRSAVLRVGERLP